MREENALDRPIIAVVGTSRSGKTVVCDILSRSPRIFCFRELHFFDSNEHSTTETPCNYEAAEQLYAKLLDIQENGILGQGNTHAYGKEAHKQVENMNLTGKPAYTVYNNFLQYFSEQQKPGARPCDQTGGYVYYIDDMRKFFPGIQFICLLRDPRFVLASKKHKWSWQQVRQSGIPYREWIRQRLQYHPWILSKLWRTIAHKSIEFKGCTDVYVLTYESLKQQTQERIIELCNYLEIEHNLDMDTVYNHKIGGVDAIPMQTPNTRIETNQRCTAMGISPTELFICQLFCASEMHSLGYDLWKVWPNPLSLLWYLLIFPVKLVLAAMANHRRISRLSDAIKRRLAV
ncbi:MAG: sulfotransferase [Deltaproteobacteria bacterium]